MSTPRSTPGKRRVNVMGTDPLEPFQRALADALGTAGVGNVSAAAREVTVALDAALADHLRLTAVHEVAGLVAEVAGVTGRAVECVLDAATIGSWPMRQEHTTRALGHLAELAQIARTAEAMAADGTEPASDPVEKGEHPQVSDHEERDSPPATELDSEMLTRLGTDGELWANEFLVHLAELAGIDPRSTAGMELGRYWFANALGVGAERGYALALRGSGDTEAVAVTLGYTGPIVHQVETVTRPPATEWTPFDPADLVANPWLPAPGGRVFVWMADARADDGGTVDIAEWNDLTATWLHETGEHAKGVTAWAPIPWPAPPGDISGKTIPGDVTPEPTDAERMADAGRRLGVSAEDALEGAARISEGVRSLGEPAGTIFGVLAGDGLDDERADATTAISILRLLLENRAMVRMGGAGAYVLVPSDTVELTDDQAELLARLTPENPV